MTCPVCGSPACAGEAPAVTLTADQLKDLGIKPEDIKPGGTIAMADQVEPKARYPKEDPDNLQKGAKHGYLGDVETYDPNEPGHSNVTAEKAPKESGKVAGAVGTTKSDDTP